MNTVNPNTIETGSRLEQASDDLAMLADLLSAANPEHLEFSESGLCALTNLLRGARQNALEAREALFDLGRARMAA